MLDINKIRKELEEYDLIMVNGGMGTSSFHVDEDKDFSTNEAAMRYGNENVRRICVKYGNKPTSFFVNCINKLFRVSFYVQG